MPIGIILALAICTILYIAVCAAMTGVVPYPMLDTAAPASYVLEYIGLHLGSAIVGTGAICGLSTVVLGMLFAQSRALYSMSRDGLMPMSLYKVHPKFHTPYIIQIIIGVVVACITGFTPIHIVAETCSAGTILPSFAPVWASSSCAVSIPTNRADSAAPPCTSLLPWGSSVVPSFSLNCLPIRSSSLPAGPYWDC